MLTINTFHTFMFEIKIIMKIINLILESYHFAYFNAFWLIHFLRKNIITLHNHMSMRDTRYYAQVEKLP